jgi:hypothetical protein
MSKWLGDHSLSISFLSLFLLSIVGQSLSGFLNYNSELAMHGFPPIHYLNYLHSGNFLDGVFTNWQAALLQLACLIVFSGVFREKGAAHSLRRKPAWKRNQNRNEHRQPWIFRNSLSLAFIVLFALSFIAHLFFGAMDQNSKLMMIHRPPESTLDYGISSAFWFANAQTWQAEFVAIAIYVVLSIFLRQQGSAESKPINSKNEETGKTNH